MQVGKHKLLNIDLIYSRVIGLQASSRDCDPRNLFSYELAPIPTSMFTEQGEMRISKGKSLLKKQLQVEVSVRSVRNFESTVIDGSALLWVAHWPIGGTVKDFVNNYRDQIEKNSHQEMYTLCLIGIMNIKLKVKHDVHENQRPAGSTD